MRKIFECIFLSIIVFISGCNLNSGTDEYYMQQSDSNGDTSGTVSEDIYVSYGKIFEVLKPNGVIDLSVLSAYNFTQTKLENIVTEMSSLPTESLVYDSILEQPDISTSNIAEYFVRSTFLSNGLMEIDYDNTDMSFIWSISNDITYLKSETNSAHQYTYFYNGKPIQMYMEGAPFANMENIVYYKYVGYNPFFTLESNYNNNLVGETDERGMERFIFYRLTGSVFTMAQDTMLMAVDTHTSLVYSYAVVTDLLKIGDMYIPSKWEAVDSVATDINGNKHLFFEYDPSGYIDCNYNFVEFEWYKNQKENIAANPTDMELYYPKFTNTSPYLIDVTN